MCSDLVVREAAALYKYISTYTRTRHVDVPAGVPLSAGRETL